VASYFDALAAVCGPLDGAQWTCLSADEVGRSGENVQSCTRRPSVIPLDLDLPRLYGQVVMRAS
jgi:hypothetical protein